ncbi:DUF7504 family protein [Halorussus halobius]|uniref:DUF7504 family protein n=1 Tax=Halorussus halobius TaxID=1710537 RepID=UPI001091BC7D|nr:hypothetical protein [Halorussus halobius]
MAPPNPDAPADDPGGVDEGLEDFVRLLDRLKSTGCSILVTGDVPRELFTRASAKLLGADEELRYRVLAVTDATAESIAGRLPDPDVTPRPLTETTHVLNHAGTLRSVTAATSTRTPPKLAGVTETRIVDPELAGLRSALFEAIDDFAAGATTVSPGDVRVGIDSLEPLIEFYGVEQVRECLGAVGRYVRTHDAMAHFVLPAPCGSEAATQLAAEVDAVVELRLAESTDDRTAEQRWHVPDRDLRTDWVPL